MKLISDEILKDAREILNSDKYTDEEKEEFFLHLLLLAESFCKT